MAKTVLITFMITYLLFWFSSRVLTNSRDDSDGKSRSGMILRTDHLTGVQYFEGAYGGLTVRVDADGKPILAAGRILSKED